MRRNDREVTDPQAIADILAASNVCRVALNGAEYPYIVPLNYGFVHADGKFTLYLHCAKEGEKVRLLRENPKVAFEVDSGHEVVSGGAVACRYSMAYQSVVGQGVLSIVEDAQAKREGLSALMANLVPGQDFAFSEEALAAVLVLRLDVLHITAKSNIKRA